MHQSGCVKRKYQNAQKCSSLRTEYSNKSSAVVGGGYYQKLLYRRGVRDQVQGVIHLNRSVASDRPLKALIRDELEASAKGARVKTTSFP